MNTKTALAIFAIVGAITLVLAPSLVTQASAKQTATITCNQETGSGDRTTSGGCAGSSAVNNPNREELVQIATLDNKRNSVNSSLEINIVPLSLF